MERFVYFMWTEERFTGSNAELTERFNSYAKTQFSPRALKQKMNQCRYDLEDCGVYFESFRSNGTRMVSVEFRQNENSDDGDEEDANDANFVINSVSFETGKKLRQHPNPLEQLRNLSDEICLAHGFSVLPPSADGRGRYEKNVRPGVPGGGQGPELEAGAGGSDQRRHVRRRQQRRVSGADEWRGLRRHLDRGKKVYHLSVSQRHEMPGQQTA